MRSRKRKRGRNPHHVYFRLIIQPQRTLYRAAIERARKNSPVRETTEKEWDIEKKKKTAAGQKDGMRTRIYREFIRSDRTDVTRQYEYKYGE